MVRLRADGVPLREIAAVLGVSLTWVSRRWPTRRWERKNGPPPVRVGAVGVLEQWRAQVAAAVQSAGAARTAAEDAQAVRDLAIREAIAAGITGYRLARETGLSESTISRIARR